MLPPLFHDNNNSNPNVVSQQPSYQYMVLLEYHKTTTLYPIPYTTAADSDDDDDDDDDSDSDDDGGDIDDNDQVVVPT